MTIEEMYANKDFEGILDTLGRDEHVYTSNDLCIYIKNGYMKTYRAEHLYGYTRNKEEIKS